MTRGNDIARARLYAEHCRDEWAAALLDLDSQDVIDEARRALLDAINATKAGEDQPLLDAVNALGAARVKIVGKVSGR